MDLCYKINIFKTMLSVLNRQGVKMNLGDRIKKERLDGKYTLRGLAEVIGVNDSTINQWELGKAVPNAKLLMKLCEYLKVSSDYILWGQSLEHGSQFGCPSCKSTNHQDSVMGLQNRIAQLEEMLKEKTDSIRIRDRLIEQMQVNISNLENKNGQKGVNTDK
jgi:transcriptional regulator with XRE-family HTH domain